MIADEKGRAEFKFSDKLVKVNDIIGRSIVVSSDPDDLGKGSSNLSMVCSKTYFRVPNKSTCALIVFGKKNSPCAALS